MTGFLQIGKNGSGHVLTLLIVSQKAIDLFLSYYTHLISNYANLMDVAVPILKLCLLENNSPFFWDTLYFEHAFN